MVDRQNIGGIGTDAMPMELNTAMYKKNSCTIEESTPIIKATWAEKRARLSYFMHHNHNFHLVITALVFLDVAVILSQLIIEASLEKPTCILMEMVYIISNNATTNVTSAVLKHPENYGTMMKVEHVLHYISISILSVFMLEIIVKIFASGTHFLKHKFEVIDAIVVSIAFFIDVLISKKAVDDAVALLVLVRLWRILHMVASVVEAVKMKAKKREVQLKKQINALEKEIVELREKNVD